MAQFNTVHRRRPRVLHRVALLVAGLSQVAVPAASAEWPTEPSSPLVLGYTQNLGQAKHSTVVTPDGAVWVSWIDKQCLESSLRVQRIDLDGGMIEVVLGADDKHLRFRSCVGVLSPAEGRLVFSLETRVETLNAFGRFYMGAIRHMHHRLIAPLMLRRAADYALRRLSGAASAAA